MDALQLTAEPRSCDNEDVLKISNLTKEKKKEMGDSCLLAPDKTYIGRILFPGKFSRRFGPLRSNEGLQGISILLVFCLFFFLS